MSYLESLERKLRTMSENGSSSGVSGENVLNNSSGTGDVVADLRVPRKFVRVLGYDGRYNDMVYCKPLAPCEEEEISVDLESDTNLSGTEETRQKVLVYFGGDMQDFPEVMEQHKEHRSYVCWNLIATAEILQKQFPSHHIVIIRPSRIQIMTFSCYDNFCNCNHTGVPDHVITHGSLQHLEALLRNLSDRVEKSQKQDEILAKQIANESKEEVGESEVSSTTTEDISSGVNGKVAAVETVENPKALNPHLDRAKLSLVGFSKGCVVLNQLLYEFHYLKTLTPDDSTMDAFVNCIEEMYWLDGGHNGGKNTWITSRSLLETLTRQEVKVHVHMTPYQLTDDRRPWIRKEERTFSDWLKRFNCPLKRYVHFENEPASLQQHFRLIAEFGTAEKTMEPEGNSDDVLSQNDPSHTVGVLSM